MHTNIRGFFYTVHGFIEAVTNTSMMEVFKTII